MLNVHTSILLRYLFSISYKSLHIFLFFYFKLSVSDLSCLNEFLSSSRDFNVSPNDWSIPSFVCETWWTSRFSYSIFLDSAIVFYWSFCLFSSISRFFYCCLFFYVSICSSFWTLRMRWSIFTSRWESSV